MSQRAFAAPANAPGTLPGRALVILATLSVIFAPSIYRGGADVAHPHGFFEFWGSDAERAFDHHGHTHGLEHDHHHAGSSDDDAVTAAAQRESRVAVGNVAENVDQPMVSPAVTPGGISSVMVISLGLMLALKASLGGRFRYPAFRITRCGQHVTPDPPPPRLNLFSI